MTKGKESLLLALVILLMGTAGCEQYNQIQDVANRIEAAYTPELTAIPRLGEVARSGDGYALAAYWVEEDQPRSLRCDRTLGRNFVCVGIGIMNVYGPPIRINDLLIQATLVDINGRVFGDENYAGPDRFDSVIIEEGDLVVGVLYFHAPGASSPASLRVRLPGGSRMETALTP